MEELWRISQSDTTTHISRGDDENHIYYDRSICIKATEKVMREFYKGKLNGIGIDNVCDCNDWYYK